MSRTQSVVIVGRPNVGKSTLFNRLLGRRKALVHNLPGVTRDRNMALVKRDGFSVQIVDTGGVLGETESPLFSLVEEQIAIAIAAGDLILHVVDARDGLTPLDAELARRLIVSGKRAVLVANKVDVPAHETGVAEFYALSLDPVIPISAEHDRGIEELWQFIVSELHLQENVTPEEERPFEGPIRIAILGKPNVGKSSLVNRLTGDNRSLVSEIPGTTRDPVDTPITWQGKDLVLIDTAGIRRKSKTGRGAEILSVILARKNIHDCDVALLVMDASAPISHQDAHIAGLIEAQRRACVVVLNKWDLVEGSGHAKEIEKNVSEKLVFMNWFRLVRVSAKTKRHIDRILPVVSESFGAFSLNIPTAVLNKALEEIFLRIPPPAFRGKQLKIHYATQTGTAPPIITIFTNSRYSPPDSYSRFLKKRLREIFPLEGSPLILKFRKE